MAKKRYKVDILSASSVEQLKKDLTDYQNKLSDKLHLLCQRLAEIGVDSAQAILVSLDAVFTGELSNSIIQEQIVSAKDRVVFLVKATSEHAIYVEFGTGIMGASMPYPGKIPVVYAQGKTIRQLADGRYGWFYQRDEKWYFTEGMISRPFMYYTGIELHERVVKVAKEIFA